MLQHQLSENFESFIWVLQFLLTDADKKHRKYSVEGCMGWCPGFLVKVGPIYFFLRKMC